MVTPFFVIGTAPQLHAYRLPQNVVLREVIDLPVSGRERTKVRPICTGGTGTAWVGGDQEGENVEKAGRGQVEQMHSRGLGARFLGLRSRCGLGREPRPKGGVQLLDLGC